MKGNDGKAARRQLSQRILACGSLAMASLLVFWMMFGSSSEDGLHAGGFDRDYEYNVKQRRKRRKKEKKDSPSLRQSLENMASATTHDFQKSLHMESQRKDHATLMKEVLAGEYALVDLTVQEEELIRAPKNSYDGVYGKFCKLDWRGRKIDPSAVPMFRDLVAASDDCEQNKFTLNLKKVADLARHQDENWVEGIVPKVLNFTVATFHESRCGSTLVANAVAAMDAEKHRSYSEAQAPAAAMTSVCGRNFSRCSKKQAVKVLRDVIYLMSRSDDPKEERVFFKFQSATTRTVEIFQRAFPEIPWMFVYRDPTQVMMSHAKDDPGLTGRANCVRSRHAPAAEIQAVAKDHGIRDARQMSGPEYCAAHLASITEAAVEALDDIAMPILYDDLPSILHTTILPKVFGRPMTEMEVTNIEAISQQYSKGRGHRHKEFKGDSEQKSEAATPEIRAAADKFLQESYDELSKHRPAILYGSGEQGDDGDGDDGGDDGDGDDGGQEQ